MKKKLWIKGMSCANCLHHLKSAFEEMGMQILDAELTEGTLTIESQSALDSAALAEVIEEAGYDFVRAEDLKG